MDTLESDNETTRYRIEAIAAFSHEIRTPLTSLKMLIELGRRHGDDGEIHLDHELTQMLIQTVDEIHELVDDVHESSRMMRGRVPLREAPHALSELFEAAAGLLPTNVTLDGTPPPDIVGAWDGARLSRAIAGFAGATDRLGVGDGRVEAAFEREGGQIIINFSSGSSSEAAGLPFNADAGFPFFRARQFVLAMGGRVECERFDHAARVRITLPYRPGLPGRESP